MPLGWKAKNNGKVNMPKKLAIKLYKVLVVIAASCASHPAIALPVGPQIISGTATIGQANNNLNITSSNGAILNWQTFNIGTNETARFIQPSTSSAVLNRVLAPDPSAILSNLTSNGQVFLVNPAGTLVGPGIKIQIDTSGIDTLHTGINLTQQSQISDTSYKFSIRTINEQTIVGVWLSNQYTPLLFGERSGFTAESLLNYFLARVDELLASPDITENNRRQLIGIRNSPRATLLAETEVLSALLIHDNDVHINGSKLITTRELSSSLAVKREVDLGLVSLATIMHGAHSRPLSQRVDTGKNLLAIAGDWGTDNHGKRKGALGFGEVGLGRNFGPVQLNFSIGQTWNRQTLNLSGHAEINGNYIYAEALIPTVENLWLTVSAQGSYGKASLRRGYITNTNTLDSSSGIANQNAWGLRFRLDWENALRLTTANVTPYMDVSHSKSKLDAYVENGGSFPASFEARTDNSTEMRLGLNADYLISGRLRLLGTAEAVHRFEKTASNIRGLIPGIVSFDVAGQSNERNWERLSIGLENELAGGTASIYINVTTKGEAPNAWLAASWKYSF